MESLVNSKLFSNIYNGKRVFVTGHTGFKGSWLCHWLQLMGAEVHGYSRKPVSNPSHFELLGDSYEGEFKDINNLDDLRTSMVSFNPDIVFHLAAQALVIPSYENPEDTYQSNMMGTFNVLEAGRKCPNLKALVCVTTDKVYENNEEQVAFVESDPLGGLDPYSSSKAGAELVAKSFRHSFLKDSNLLMATVRAGNVIGGGDWSDYRLIPDIVKAASGNNSVKIRSPKSIRPWQHVLESLSGYLILGMNLLQGNKELATAFNFGPEDEGHATVSEVLDVMSSVWSEIKWEDVSNSDHVYESKVLKLNCEFAKEKLQWLPIWSLRQGLEVTANWYKNFYSQNTLSTTEDIKFYCDSAKRKGVSWAQD